MQNAREELDKILVYLSYSYDDIKCFNIAFYPQCCEPAKVKLKGSNVKELQEKINFIYDNGYGMQHLHGVILFKDGAWIERVEYDGSEWWEYKKPLTCKDIEEMEFES